MITLPHHSTLGQDLKNHSGKLGTELPTMGPSNPKYAQPWLAHPSDLCRQVLMKVVGTDISMVDADISMAE